ncbi:MAG: hypothetical protein MJZ87_04295, partial [Bacteroidales bacterium]|nr:hypothetical protein [Bacteroidales bacterium]
MITKSTSNQNNKKQNFKSLLLTLVAVVIFSCLAMSAWGQTTRTVIVDASNSNWKPSGVSCFKITKIECWGGGGAGSCGGSNSNYGNGGGGGGYAGASVNLPANAGVNISIGQGGQGCAGGSACAGGNGGNTTVSYNGVVQVGANGGKSGGNGRAGGQGGWSEAGLTLTTHNGGSGGIGYDGITAVSTYSGAGGTGAGSTQNGNDGNNATGLGNASPKSGVESNPGSNHGASNGGTHYSDGAGSGKDYGGGGGGSCKGSSGSGAKGCVRITYIEYSNPTANISGNTSICQGNSTTLTASGGTSYKWSTNATSNSISVQPNTNTQYTVTVTDANGCTATKTVTVSVNPTPTVTIFPASATICAGTTQSLTASGASSYQWSTNSTSQSISVSQAGTYTVTGTSNGCSATASATVTVFNPSLTLGNIESKTICQGSSTTLTVPVTAHTGNLSYAWSNGLGNNATSGNISTAGDYTVTVTATEGSCTATATKTGHVTVNNPQVTLNDLEAQTICDGSSTTLTASVASSEGEVTYAWSNGLGTNATSGSITSSGTYSVTATATIGSCTATDVASATVSIYPTFSAGAIATTGQQRCYGDGSNSGIGSTTAATGGDGSISYQWQLNGADIAGATSATYTPAQTEPGTYTFTRYAKDGTCADWTQSTGSYTLTIYALPTLSEPENRTQTVCAGNAIEDITFTYTNATSIQVSNLPAGLSLSGNKITGTPTESGTYTVTTVNANGCTEVSRQGTITVNELPTLTVTPTNVTCNGKDNGKLAVAVSGGTPSYTINNNSTSVGTLAAAGTYNIENLEPGNYTVSVTDNNGCSATADSKTITQPEPLTVTIDSHTDVSCYGGNDATFTITISGGIPMSNGKYYVSVDRRYYSGGTFRDNLSAGTHTVSSPWGFPAGEYEIYISDGNGCYSSKQYVTVTQPTELKATITAQTHVLCKGDETGSVTVTATEGTGTAPYQYKIGSGSYQDNGTFNELAAGTYTVTVKDAHGCTKDVPVTITEPESLPTVTVNNANICLGQQSATLTATVSSDITEYLWSNGETTQSITVAPSTATSYKVTVTNGNGCTAEATGTVGIYAIPQVSITPIANELCPNIGTKELTATITSATVAPYTYTWSGDLTVSDAAINGTTISGTATIPTDCNANYTVQMDVEDANGCTAQATTTITVKDITKPTIGHNIPGSVIDVVPAANCTYTIPDLTGRVNGTDGCSSTFTKTQEPAAGTPITVSQYVTVTVVDECNNSNSTNIYVIVPDALALTENTHTNINCYNGSDGSITVNAATGGTAPYTYAIDGGTTGENKTFSGLAAGEHTITVYDNNGCSKNLTVTLTQPEQLTLTLTPTKETCTGHDGKIETTVNGGTTPYSYAWSNGHNTASCDTLTSLVNGGVYTVTVTDAHGCTATETITVELDNPLAMEPITGPTRCTGTEFSITPENGTNGVIPDGTKYYWPAPTASGVSGLAESNGYEERIHGILTNNTSDPIQVTYTVTPKVGVCEGNAVGVTVTVTTTVNPEVTVTMPNALTKCANADNFPIEATFVNSNSAATAVWKLGDETVATHNLSADTHTDSYTVDLPNDVCQGQYNYHVYYTDESGCTADDECVITVNAGEWSIDNTTYPNGSADVECVTAATDPSSFAPTGAQILDGCGRATTRTLYSTVTTPNPIVCEGTVTYTYRYTACDETYQDWTYTYNIKDNTVPAFAAGILTTKPADIDQTKCEFTVPDLTADVRAKVSDNCTAAADLVITQNPAAGTVITAATDVVVTVEDKCEKQSTHTVNVTVPTLPTVILSAGVVDCKGNATGSATVTASNGTPGYTYLWSNGKTTAAITDLTAGEYSVTVTDANGCKVDDQIEVTEPDELEVAIAATDNKTAICYGGNIDLTATAEGGNGTYTYAWTNSTETDNSINVAPTTTTTYTVTVTDAKNCTATGNFLLTVNSLPVISISDVDPLCPTIGTQELTATLTTTSATPYRYAWTGNLTVTPANTPAAPVSIPDPSDEQILNAPAGTDATSNTVTATIPTTCGTNYAVSVTVTDANGCTATDNATVSVKTPVKPVIEVAKNSNPNGDCNPEIIAPTFNVIDECNASAVATVTTTGVQGDSYEKTQTWTAAYANSCGAKADTVKVTYNWIEDHIAPKLKTNGSWPSNRQDLDYCLSNSPAFPTAAEIAALFTDEHSGDIRPEQVSMRLDTNIKTTCFWSIFCYYTIVDDCGNPYENSIHYDGSDQSAPELIHEWPADITGIDACKAAGTENYEEVYDLLDAHFDIQPYVDSYFEDCAAITVGNHFDSITGDDCEWKITRFFPIADACGNKDTLKVEVSGGDHTKPTFTAPANTTIYCKSSCSFDANVGKTGDVTNEWDNCSTDIQATHYDNDLTRDECGGWILKRKWSLEDNCHNKAEDQIQVITILDTVAPVMAEGKTWPADISNYNSCYADRPEFPSISDIAVLFYDSCSQDILETNVSYQDKNITESNCGWSITREYTIKDKCNNATVKSITYSGSDRTAPVRNTDPWPSNITGKNSCLADADISGLKSDEDIASLYTDCGKVTVTHIDNATGNDCEWTITRTYTVKDTCNNQVTPSPTMSVSGGDHIKPTFTAPAAITIERRANCSYDFSPTATGDVTDEADNCSTGLEAYSSYNSGQDVVAYDESTYNTTLTRTWHLEDNCGNKAADQVQVITIIDVTAPELEGTWPSDITNQDNCLANAVTTGLKSDAAIHDLFFDCSLPITVTHKDDTTSTDCSWTITRTYTIKDVKGNTVTPAPTMSVSGGDLTAPVMKQSAVWPSNISNYNSCFAGKPAFPTNAEIAALFTDACSGDVPVANVSYEDKDITDYNCGWTITREYTIEDACGNAVSPKPTITYSGKDLDVPTLTVPGSWPSNITDQDNCLANADKSGLKSNEYIKYLFSDCGPIVVTSKDDTTGNNCAWTITRTYTIADMCGNTYKTWGDVLPTMSVSGGDKTAPVLAEGMTWPANISGENSCLANANTSLLKDNAYIKGLFTDCGNFTVNHNDMPTGDDCGWTITRFYTIEDACHNSYQIPVQGAPVMTLSGFTQDELREVGGPVTTQRTVACISDAKRNFAMPTIQDACGNRAERVSTEPVVGGTYGLEYPECEGTRTYTYTYQGCNTLTYEWTFTYNIEREDFTMPADQDSTVACIAMANQPADADLPTVKDNCGNVLIYSTVTEGGTYGTEGHECEGTKTYSYTYTDCEGNHHDWTFTYNINMPAAPALTGIWPDNISNYNSCYADRPTFPSNAEIKALYTPSCGKTLTVTSEDINVINNNCGWSITRQYTITDGCTPVTNSITYSGSDQTAPIMKQDAEWPDNVTTEQNVCKTGADNSVLKSNADIKALFTDCSDIIVTSEDTYTTESTDCAWTLVRTFTVKDSCGNTYYTEDNELPTMSVSGGDKTAPTFTVPADITICRADDGSIAADPETTGKPTEILDNCTDSDELTVEYHDIDTLPASDLAKRVITRQWSVTDKCNNTTTKEQKITVNPKPVVNDIDNQAVCHNTAIETVEFGTTITDGTMSYAWTRTNENIGGLAMSGTGNISAATLTNTTATAQTTTITVTPTYTNNDVACVGDPKTFTITVYPQPTVSVTPVSALCKDSTSGKLQVQVAYGTPNYNIYLNDSETAAAKLTADGTTDITNLLAGKYVVKVVDTNSCSVLSDTVTITEPEAVVLSNLATTDVKCYLGTDGTISYNVTGGTPGYTVTFTKSGESTPSHTDDPASAGNATVEGFAAGTYSVVVTDDNNCKTIPQDIEVKQPDTLIASIADQVNVGCHGSNNGSVTIQAQGGVGNYQYKLNDGDYQNSNYFGTLIKGNYVVTVIDSNECSATVPVEIREPNELTVHISGDPVPVNCYAGNDGAFAYTITGGTKPYSISVVKADSAITVATPTDSLYTQTALKAGNYVVAVSDAQGCTDTLKVEITQPEAPLTVTLTTTLESCNSGDGSITAHVSGGTEPYAYEWSDYEHTVLAGYETAVAENLMGHHPEGSSWYPGRYYVTIIDKNNCQVSADTVVELNNTLQMGDFEIKICSGHELNFDPSSVPGNVLPDSTTYTWSLGEPYPIPDYMTVDPASLGAANVDRIRVIINTTQDVTAVMTVVPNAGVCIGDPANGAITVTAVTTPLTEIHVDTAVTICPTASNYVMRPTFTPVNSDYIIKWVNLNTADTVRRDTLLSNTNSDTLQFDIYQELCDTTYKWNIIYEDGIGCKANDIVKVRTKVSPWEINANAVDSSKNIECITAIDPESDIILPTVTDSCGTGIDGILYRIDTIVTPGSCERKVQYTYRYTACDSTHKDWKFTYNIKDVTVPTFAEDITTSQPSVIDHSACVFSIPDLTDTVRAKTNDNCTLPADFEITQSPAAGTVITEATDVEVTVTDQCGNSSTHTINVTVPTLPQAEILAENIQNVRCYDGNDGSMTVTVTNGTAPYKYLWSNGQTTQTASNLTAATTGTTYSVIVTDTNGCVAKDTAMITEPTQITLYYRLPSQISCHGASDGSIYFYYIGGTPEYNITIPSLDRTQETTEGYTIFYNVPAGTYSYTLSDANNCAIDNGSVEVKDVSAITITNVVTDLSCYNDNTGAIDITVTGGNSTTYTYVWKKDDSTSTYATTQDIAHLAAGQYNVEVQDSKHCNALDTFTVNQPDSLIIDTVITKDITCFHGSDGEITITDNDVTGGTPSYNYALVQGTDTLNSFTDLTAGVYNVVVTDAHSCKANRIDTLTEPDSLHFLTCYEDMELECDSAKNYATKELVDPEFAPALNGASIIARTNVADNNQYVPGIDTITYVVTNTCGERDTCQFTITVKANEPPVLTCPTIAHQACLSDVPAPYASYDEYIEDGGLAEDDQNAIVKTTFRLVEADTTGTACNDTITRKYGLQDAAGNEGYCEQVIVVKDTLKPVITGTLIDDTVYLTGNSCGDYLLPNEMTTVGEALSHRGNLVITDCNVTAETQLLIVTPDENGVGTCDHNFVRTYTVMDACNNSSTFTHKIHVVDTLTPSIAGNWADSTVYLTTSDCDSYTLPTAYTTIEEVNTAAGSSFIQNCNLTPAITHEDVEYGDNSCNHYFVRTYTVSDSCSGKSNTFTHKIEVKDTLAPALTGIWPADQNGLDYCTSAVPAGPTKEYIKAQFSDCYNFTVDSSYVLTGTDCNWTAYYVYEIEDACGNAFKDTVTFTGGDQTAPTFTRPNDTTLYLNASCEVDTTT